MRSVGVRSHPAPFETAASDHWSSAHHSCSIRIWSSGIPNRKKTFKRRRLSARGLDRSLGLQPLMAAVDVPRSGSSGTRFLESLFEKTFGRQGAEQLHDTDWDSLLQQRRQANTEAKLERNPPPPPPPQRVSEESAAASPRSPSSPPPPPS